MHSTLVWKSRLRTAAALLGAAFVLGACTDTVFRDRPPFNPAPDATAGFLGYYDVAQGQTTCGNCHVGQQGDWSQTAHSQAWATLQNSGAAQPFCEGCHSVNSRGNQAFASAGYDKVKSNAYHDVQCESCHGPGAVPNAEHVRNPTVLANRPYASIQIYPTSPVTDTAAVVNSGCGACHTDNQPAKHHNFLKEWLSSRHGQVRAYPAGNVSGGCPACHEAKGFLKVWVPNTIYKEIAPGAPATLLPQNCVVCHDPHGTAKDANGQTLLGQLRFPINEPDVAANLCTKCHSRRAEITSPSSSSGPHGPQGPVVFGTAGYFPPGTIYDTSAILTTHGSTANTRLCAGCHVNRLTGVDASGNSITFSGHSFHPLPCLMQKTPPVADPTFSNACAFDEPSRSWTACTQAGCHGSEAVAVTRLTQIWAEKDGYVNTLWRDVDGDRALDAFPTDSGYLPKIKLNAPTELVFCNLTGTSNLCTTAADSLNSQRLTPAKGAFFNAQLTGEHLANHPDGSHGVHNPFLYRALLQSSIADLLANYGTFLPAPPAPILAKIQGAIRSGELKMAPETERAIMSASMNAMR